MLYEKTTEKNIMALETYEIREHSFLSDINTDSYLLHHKKSGARLILFPNEDRNKSFYIAFKTPPADSSGVAHIMEHAVLGGSRAFPSKRTFVEAKKRSAASILSAMTSQIYTCFPVTTTSDKDFKNLMHIYMDAVFHPNIYKDKRIFEREGWHYEVDQNGQLRINGIVYNEMKGVLSDPEQVLQRVVNRIMLPGSYYSHVAGGDPEHISELSYEEFLDFHRKYYHPSNCYIFLGGDLDMVEQLEWLDKFYLSEFTRKQIECDLDLSVEAPANKDHTVYYNYDEGEDETDKAWFSLSYVVPGAITVKERTALCVLEYYLCNAECGVLSEAVQKAGAAHSVLGYLDFNKNVVTQSFVAAYIPSSNAALFEKTILKTLNRLVNEGLDRESILGTISTEEFKYLDQDYGSVPKTMSDGFSLLSDWMYDENRVFEKYEKAYVFDELRREVDTGYFENLIKHFFLENENFSRITMLPDKELEARRAGEFEEKLSGIWAGMSKEEQEQIVRHAQELKEWHDQPEDENDLAKIPSLQIEDISKVEPKTLCNVAGSVKCKDGFEVKTLCHPLFTGGIDHITLSFDITDLPDRFIEYYSVFVKLFGSLGTTKHTYTEIDQLSSRLMGQYGFHDGDYFKGFGERTIFTYELMAKLRHGNLVPAMELLKEIITETQFDDKAKIRELLERERIILRDQIMDSGYAMVLLKMMDYYPRNIRSIRLMGLDHYKILNRICTYFDECFDELKSTMEEMMRWIFQRKHLLFDITASEHDCQEAIDLIPGFADSLSDNEFSETCHPKTKARNIPINKGYITSTPIQYAIQLGSYYNKGYEYTGAMEILEQIIYYEYLWPQLREKQGVYSFFTNIGRDGIVYFVTLMDPNYAESFKVFAGIPDFLRSYSADQSTIDGYIIKEVGKLDRPVSNSALGRISYSSYMADMTYDDYQKKRDEILGTTVETIRLFADFMEAVLADGCIACVGSREKTEEHSDLFEMVAELI